MQYAVSVKTDAPYRLFQLSTTIAECRKIQEIKTNKIHKNKQKSQKTKTHKNRKYANNTMNAIYLIYNRVSG